MSQAPGGGPLLISDTAPLVYQPNLRQQFTQQLEYSLAQRAVNIAWQPKTVEFDTKALAAEVRSQDALFKKKSNLVVAIGQTMSGVAFTRIAFDKANDHPLVIHDASDLEAGVRASIDAIEAIGIKHPLDDMLARCAVVVKEELPNRPPVVNDRSVLTNLGMLKDYAVGLAAQRQLVTGYHIGYLFRQIESDFLMK